MIITFSTESVLINNANTCYECLVSFTTKLYLIIIHIAKLGPFNLYYIYICLVSFWYISSLLFMRMHIFVRLLNSNMLCHNYF